MDMLLPEGAYAEWLTASATQYRGFMVPFNSDKLLATLKARPRFRCHKLFTAFPKLSVQLRAANDGLRL